MRKKLIKRAAMSIALTAALLPGLFGCAGSAEGDGKTAVRIAYFPNITHSQALVMKAQGTLEEMWADTCTVTWTSFNAGPAETEAIFAGEIDLGYIGPVPALSANTKSGGEVKILSNSTDYGAVLLVRKDAAIDSIADLSGKTVAVPQLGNTQHLCLLALLSANGLKTADKGGDVTVSASANADILNLMGSGRVDAALVPEPWGTTIEKDGHAEVLLNFDEVMPISYPSALVVVSEDFMTAHPELVREFLKAHEETTVYINGHRDEAIRTVNAGIREATGKALEDDVIERAFTRMKITTELNREAIKLFAQTGKEEGFLTAVPEETDVFTTEFNQ